MSIQIDLNPEMEADLAARAAACGVPLSQYVRTVLEQLVPTFGNEQLSPEERARALREWADQFPYRRTTPISDEALSRESLYHTEGE